MKCTPETKWKYLRETDKKFYNPDRNTTLPEYLSAIFPNNKFEYNSSIRKDELPEGIEKHRYRCDAICRELKLIVEFDGINHYIDTSVAENDIKRDKWFKSIGYTTVRIPYWIQLSREVIQELFNIDIEDEFCTLPFSFYNPENDSVNLDILPGNMCESGRNRFIREFNSFSPVIQLQVLQDLQKCASTIRNERLIKMVLPSSIVDELDINYLWNLDLMNKMDKIENIIFEEDVNIFMYSMSVRSYFDLTLDKLKQLEDMSVIKQIEDSIEGNLLEELKYFMKQNPQFTLSGHVKNTLKIMEEPSVFITGIYSACKSSETIINKLKYIFESNNRKYYMYTTEHETYFATYPLID